MTNRKSILMISSGDYTTSSRYYRFGKILADNGYNVDFFCSGRFNPLLIKKKIDKINVFFIKTPFDKVKLNFLFMSLFLLYFSIKMFLKTLKGKRYDIIYSYTFDVLGLSIVLKHFHRAKLIYDSAEYYPGFIKPDVPILVFYIIRSLYFKLGKKSDHILTTNSWTKHLFELANCKNITVFPNVPNIETFYPSVKNRDIIRRKLNIKSNEVVFSFIGLLAPLRGVEEIIESVNLLAKINRKNFKILIVGRGILKNKLIQKVKEDNLSDYFIIHDFVPLEEVPKFLNASDVIFILYNPKKLNNWFSVPNKLFEAVACAKPVIASDFGHLKKLVLDLKCGLLANSNDPLDIKEKMQTLIESPKLRKELGRKGLRRAKNKYNLKNYSKIFINIIKKFENGKCS